MTRISNTLLWLLVSVLAARLGLSALLPFADTTEPRYAEMARIMAETGDWITPWFDIGVPFWGKPPLSFWTQALSFKLFGVSEFAGRLPSWLANVGIVWLVYNLRRYLHPDPLGHGAKTQGLWAALIYTTTALGFLSAGTVMTDSFLALGTSLTLVSLIIRLQGGAAALGLAVLHRPGYWPAGQGTTGSGACWPAGVPLGAHLQPLADPLAQFALGARAGPDPADFSPLVCSGGAEDTWLPRLLHCRRAHQAFCGQRLAG